MSLPTCSTAPKLTPREGEGINLIARGFTNKKIAEDLFIADGTVEIHVHNILNKLDAANRAQAVVSAIRLGLIEVDM